MREGGLCREEDTNTCRDWDDEVGVAARKQEAPRGNSTHPIKPRSVSTTFLEDVVNRTCPCRDPQKPQRDW